MPFLNLLLGSIAKGNATFGEGSGLIYLERISCVGREDSVLDCSNPGLEMQSCVHAQDAGVVCQCKQLRTGQPVDALLPDSKLPV